MKNKSDKNKTVGQVIGEFIKTVSHFLFMIFLTLRACEIIQWPWYWIMMPLFVKFAITFLSAAIIGLFAAVEVNETTD